MGSNRQKLMARLRSTSFRSDSARALSKRQALAALLSSFCLGYLAFSPGPDSEENRTGLHVEKSPTSSAIGTHDLLQVSSNDGGDKLPSFSASHTSGISSDAERLDTKPHFKETRTLSCPRSYQADIRVAAHQESQTLISSVDLDERRVGSEMVKGMLKRRRKPEIRLYHTRDLHGVADVIPVHNIQDLTQDDLIIITMGPTGAGKSTFIQTVAGERYNNNEVGHNLRSATSQVSALRITFKGDQEGQKTNLVLVDTPGFDDTEKSDLDILKLIADWLKRVAERQSASIGGILYLHRITDVRMSGTVLKNFNMFQKLCGEDFFRRVILTTTMWPDANDSEERERCEIRLEDLLDNYWASMMARGSQSHEFTKELSSAEEIINRIICIHREGRADEHIVQIQKEMVYDLKKIPNTQAGRHLHGVMEELVERQNRILAQLRRELAECSFQDQKVVDELFGELKNLRKQREKATKDLHELQAPWALAKLRAWLGDLQR